MLVELLTLLLSRLGDYIEYMPIASKLFSVVFPGLIVGLINVPAGMSNCPFLSGSLLEKRSSRDIFLKPVHIAELQKHTSGCRLLKLQ